MEIRSSQLMELEAANWTAWVARHVGVLEDLLPDLAALCLPGDFEKLVEGLLRRADLLGMQWERETVAYCYSSLTLGIGFESRPDLEWVGAAMSASGEERAELLWDGVEAEIDRLPEDSEAES